MIQLFNIQKKKKKVNQNSIFTNGTSKPLIVITKIKTITKTFATISNV
jgi:hypothetical protein